MQVSVDSQQAAKRKPSFVKKVAKAVKTKSQKLRKKLCSAVVRPQTTQKQYANDKHSEEDCGEIPNETKSNQVLIVNNPKDYVTSKEDVDTNHM